MHKPKNDEKAKHDHQHPVPGIFILIGIVLLLVVFGDNLFGAVFGLVGDAFGLVFGFIGGVLGLVLGLIGTILGFVFGLIGHLLGFVFGIIGLVLGLVGAILGIVFGTMLIWLPLALLFGGAKMYWHTQCQQHDDGYAGEKKKKNDYDYDYDYV
jgi:hypothetical protein